jgi:hypothetical protein
MIVNTNNAKNTRGRWDLFSDDSIAGEPYTKDIKE